MNDKKIKNLKYAELMDKLKKSIESEFYYEAIFIEFAVLEDRTESLLRHAKCKTVDIDGKSLKLVEKIKKIMYVPQFREEYVAKHITKDFIAEIDQWRDKRNNLIHGLVNTSYTNDDVKKIALDGYEMIKKLNTKSTSVNKYFDNKI